MDEKVSNHNNNIIIVDDSLDNLRYLKDVLVIHGYQVRTFTNGKEALESINTDFPSLILLDIMMPSMDGYEVCQRLKSNELLNHIPVIFISALNDEASYVAGFNAGGTDFISKPFRRLEILARVNTHIKLHDALLHSRSQQKRLQDEIEARKLVEQELYKSKEQYMATLYGIGDGVITTDSNGYVLLMNQVAESLTGWTQQEAIGHVLENIFRIINEKTRKNVEIPVRKVLRDGAVVGLANHTLLISRQGKEIPIADSGAPIRNSEGQIIGVVLVFRDQTEERAAENRLKDSEDRFRSLYENSAVGISMTDSDGNISGNKAFCNMLGYSIAEFKEINWRDITYPDDIQKSAEVSNSLILKEKEKIRIEKRYIHKNGEIIWADISSTIQWDTEGKPTYFITSVTDITARKKAEEKSLKFKMGIDNSEDAIFITDLNGIIEYINPAFKRIYGFSTSESLGKTPRILKSGLLSQSVYEHFWHQLLSKKPVSGEIQNKTKDGRIITIDATNNPIVDEKGDMIGFISINRDVTERKNTELKLIESEEKFRTLAESTPVAICIYQDDHWVYINPAGEKMGGYTAEELYQNKYWEFVSPEFQDFVIKRGKDRQAGDKNQISYEFKAINREGKTRWVFLTGSTIKYNGKPAGIISVIDITDKKESERLLQESEEMHRTIFENNQATMLIIDPESGDILEANNSAASYYGWSQAALTSMNIAQIDTLSPEEIKLELTKLGENDQNYFQYIHRLANGLERNVEVYSSRILRKGKTVLFSIIYDITERKNAEEALKAAEERFRSVFENTMVGLYRTTPEGKIILANPALIKILGFNSFEELQKRNLENEGFDLEDLRKEFKKTIEKDGYVDNYEYNWIKQDGSVINVRENARCISDDDGKIHFYDGVVEDITASKKVKEAHAYSESRYSDIFKYAPVGIYLSTKQGDFITLNNRLAEILGYESIDELKVKNLENDIYYNNDERDLLIAKYEPGGSVLNIDVQWKKKDGNPIWISLSSHAIKDEKNNTLFYEGFVHDRSAGKKIEEDILSERRLLRTLIDNIPDPIYVKDTVGRKMVANIADVLNIGRSNESDVLGKTDLELFEGEIGERGFSDDSTIFQTGEAIINREEKFIDKNGHEHWLLTSKIPIFNDQGGMTGLVGIGREITEIKNAGNQIRKLSKSIEQSPSTIIITDTQGQIEYVNPKFIEITGYDAEEVIGKKPSILKSGQMSLEFYQQLWNTISSGEVWRGEFLNRKKNGELYWEWATMTSIKDETGTITNYIAIKEDISLRKKIEADLIIAKNKAEESDRLKSAFLANMSHEVRTPLNSIIGFSELLADPDFEEDNKREFIQHIISNGNNLLTIISDIMDISKLEAGELKIYSKPVNVYDFISNIKNQIAYQSGIKGLDFEANIPDARDISIFVDPDRLRQIINNLISNAIKFTAKGGIEIGYQLSGEMVEFYVKDTGIGIPLEYHDKIFERFRQVEDERTRKYGGNGLGLAITKNLVELMGGNIWLKTKEGQETIFYFTIPKHTN